MTSNINNILSLGHLLAQLQPDNDPRYNGLIIDALAREFILFQKNIEITPQLGTFNKDVVSTLSQLFPPSPASQRSRDLYARLSNYGVELAKKLPEDQYASKEQIIHAIAQTILHSQEGREEKLNALRALRSSLLAHVPVNGIKHTTLYINLSQIDLAPTPLCPAYNKMCVPTLSSYQIIFSNRVILALDPSAWEFVPQKVKEMAGDLSGKKLDLFWTVIENPSGWPERPLNLCTHTWSHPEAQRGDDIAFDVDMGISPVIGFQRADIPGAIAIDTVSPMRVHAHPDGGRNQTMLYSPDNAHFLPIPGAPIGVLWSVLKSKDRVAVSKMIVLLDGNYPLCQLFNNAARRCPNLREFLLRMHAIPEQIDTLFEQALSTFDLSQLPLHFQHKIYEQAWRLKKPPNGLHNDFGRASFENAASLKADYHCSPDEKRAIIHDYRELLREELFTSQLTLLFTAQPHFQQEKSPETTSEKLTKLALDPQFSQMAIEERKAAVLSLLDALPEETRNKIFGGIYHHSSDPHKGGPNWGKEHVADDAEVLINALFEV